MTNSHASENLVIQDCFLELNDPRRVSKGNIKYSLQEIIFLTLSAVVIGFQTYELIEGFGEERISWLRKFTLTKMVFHHTTLWVNFLAELTRRNFQNV